MIRSRLARRKSFVCRRGYRSEDWATAATPVTQFSPEGLMQEYVLEAYLEGAVDLTSGMVLNIAELDQELCRVVGPLESMDLSDSKMAVHLFEQLRERFSSPVKLMKVRLHTSREQWIDVCQD